LEKCFFEASRKMRTFLSTVLAVMLSGPAAFGADKDGLLPAGKPAGIKAAQLDVTDTAVIATTAAILITAVVLGATQKSYTSISTTSTNSP
jgi:hypothetical protein